MPIRRIPRQSFYRGDLPHTLTFPNYGVRVLQMWLQYQYSGPERRLSSVIVATFNDTLPSEKQPHGVLVLAPKQANDADEWLAKSRVFYTNLPARILNPIQRTLFNTEV